MKPDFLVVGHIVKDVVADGWVPGGGVLYAAAQARALGLKVAAVTRCSSDLQPMAILPGVDWHVAPSDVSTSFENKYVDGRRVQGLPALAAPLSIEDVPAEWLDAPIVLLAPVFHDVEPSLSKAVARPQQLVGLGAQGWLRRLEAGKVLPGEVEAHPSWLAGDIIFVSEEDLVQPEAAKAWRSAKRTIVLTRGLNGCSIWDAAGHFDVPGTAVNEVDATGAGDVFATAFLVRRRETGDNREAARFATAAAALAVQQAGIAGIGSRAAIDILLSRETVRT
jgi:hypothetical protein